ncbi:MAG: hypothetical protein ABL959_07485 [Pyrinomonadaceae bacterium]
MTIFTVIAYGLLPLVSVFPFTGGFLLVGPRFLPFNGSIQLLYRPDGEISLLLLVITLSLCFLSAGSAVVAFLGIGEARVATLIFVTLNVGWWFFLVVLMLIDSDGRSSIGLIGQLIFPPVWLAFVWWNFTRPDISAYYRYMATLEG